MNPFQTNEKKMFCPKNMCIMGNINGTNKFNCTIDPNERFDPRYVSACGSWCNHLLLLQFLSYHIWVITNYINKMD